MAEEITLAQMAEEIARLRRQIEQINQRLDMIYGAVNRLADQMESSKKREPEPVTESQTGLNLSPLSMMDPGSMLDSLHEYAVKSGLDIPQDTVDQLKKSAEQDEESDEA